jgi:hypothetical protein
MGDAPGPVQQKSHAQRQVDALKATRASAIGKDSSSASYWRKLEPRVQTLQGTQGPVEVAMLWCTLCHRYLAASNPPRTGATHFKEDGTCKGKRSLDEMEEGALDAHSLRAASPAAVALALRELALFFFTTNTALHLVENQHLRACLRALGVRDGDLLSRKQLSTTYLDAEHGRAVASLTAVLVALTLINLATDGWKKQSAVQGANLSNCMVLPPRGGAHFFDVEDTSQHKKDARYVADLHLRLLDKASGGNEDKQNSVVMDNTSTNRAAMALIKEARPWVIPLGCAVRARDLRAARVAGLLRMHMTACPACCPANSALTHTRTRHTYTCTRRTHT